MVPLSDVGGDRPHLGLSVTRSELGPVTETASGGHGVVYSAPDAAVAPGPLVYKEYRGEVGEGTCRRYRRECGGY